MRKRMRAMLLGAATLAVVAASAAPVASVDLAGGCPPGEGWSLAPVGLALDELDNGSYADQNGDGWGCYRVNQGQTNKHGSPPSFTWKDNTNPL